MIYVMSDIHGNLRRFKSVMKKIDLQPEDTLYVLGDVVDRHPYGIEILQEIMAMPNAKMILGNHEHMMLNAMVPQDTSLPWKRDGGLKDLKLWYRNHGQVTEEHLKKLSQEDRQRLFDFLIGLPLSVDIVVGEKLYKLVHASPKEFYHKDKWGYLDQTQFAVWERIEDYTQIPDEYTLVFGHTPTLYYCAEDRLRIWHDKNKIGIDCGSGLEEIALTVFPHQGNLACLRLDDMQEFYSDEADKPIDPNKIPRDKV